MAIRRSRDGFADAGGGRKADKLASLDQIAEVQRMAREWMAEHQQ